MLLQSPTCDFFDLQRRLHVTQSVGNYLSQRHLTDGDVPERVQAYRVTPNTFRPGVPAA